MASLTPAERTGSMRRRNFEPGKWADLLILNNKLQVERVFLQGEESI